MDEFLDKRLKRYDAWLGEGTISFSSRVIPVFRSLAARQWVLPAMQARDILRRARSVAVQNCGCKTHYSRCDNPREVCFLLNDAGDRAACAGTARTVTPDEAEEILRTAEDAGLVHLALYQPDHELYALCNCCPCCCHDLRIMKQYNRPDLIARADYVARTDRDACTGCGKCGARCFFGARSFEDDRLVYDEKRCFGCGLCAVVCPEGATVIVPRKA